MLLETPFSQELLLPLLFQACDTASHLPLANATRNEKLTMDIQSYVHLRTFETGCFHILLLLK